jgi:hypothetical protein
MRRTGVVPQVSRPPAERSRTLRPRLAGAARRTPAARPARADGVSCDSWGDVFPLVNAVSARNTPVSGSLAHLVWGGLGFPYI